MGYPHLWKPHVSHSNGYFGAARIFKHTQIVAFLMVPIFWLATKWAHQQLAICWYQTSQYGVENYWTTTIFTFGKAFSPLKPTGHPVTRTRSPGRSLHSPWSRAWSQVFVPKEVQIKVACNGRSETNLPAKQSSANAKWKPSELEIVLKNGVSEHTH